MNLLTLIPCRTGSKGIPDKNFRSMCGKALWFHSFLHADAVEKFVNLNEWAGINTIISTDDCGRFPDNFSCVLIDRPNEFATDESPIIDTIKDAIEQVERMTSKHYDGVVLLQPTSPNRSPEDILKCIAMFVQKEGKHGVVSGYLMRIKTKGTVDNKTKSTHFQRNGAIFVIPRENIDKGIILDGDEYEIEMPKSRSSDIDTEDDWKEAEAMMEYLLRRGEK